MKRAWPPGAKIAVQSVGLAVLAVIATWITVREFQHGAHAKASAEMMVSQNASVPVSTSGRLVGMFADGIEDLRAQNHVTLIPASSSQKTLGEIPAGSYAFVFAPFVAHSAPNALQVYAHNDPAYFEVHKLANGQTEFIGYVGSDTKERLQRGLSAGEMLTLYSSSWPKASELTAISFGSVKCMRSRDMAIRRKGGTIVLFALDCKAMQSASAK
jgi:hypothetical protein